MLKKSLFFISLVSVLSANSYEQWLKSQNNEYNSYKKSMDKEFSDMLKKDWESFKAMSTPPVYKEPKPLVVPTVTKKYMVPVREIINSPKVVTKPILIKEIIDVKKVTPLKKDYKFNSIDLDFYGEKISIQYDKKSLFELSRINKTTISNFWDNISKTDFNKLIKQINKQSDNLNLNDWAKYQLINKIGQKIYKNENTANLFTWFVLVKLNFDTKVGYSNDKIYLLSTIKHSLYQIAFFKLNSKRYYVLTSSGRVGKIGNMYTYKGEYPKSKEKLSFVMDKNIKLYQDIKSRELNFTFKDISYKIDAKYSNELINFYKTFPQSDYNIYFNTKNSRILLNSLVKGLHPLVIGKSEIEAVNLLLRFTQTSFKYKTDQQQFNYEKVMFPEETIFYHYSDCEDRSIMFSYLVKELLSLDVVGIKYKDHLATAVRFSSNVSGDGFIYKSKKYTISDPTYINASTGMAMPQYKNSKFEIISLR